MNAISGVASHAPFAPEKVALRGHAPGTLPGQIYPQLFTARGSCHETFERFPCDARSVVRLFDLENRTWQLNLFYP